MAGDRQPRARAGQQVWVVSERWIGGYFPGQRFVATVDVVEQVIDAATLLSRVGPEGSAWAIPEARFVYAAHLPDKTSVILYDDDIERVFGSTESFPPFQAVQGEPS